MTEPTGRRERKKAQTRAALADAALRLFLERGFDQVSVKEVADAADVAVTTLFKHFPTKESLVFDEEGDVEAALVAAVRERPAGRSVLAALHAHVRAGVIKVAGAPASADFRRMIEETPSLREYWHLMWLRHEAALARAIVDETGIDEVRCAALARFALEAGDLGHRHPEPGAAVDEIFDLIERGWSEG